MVGRLLDRVQEALGYVGAVVHNDSVDDNRYRKGCNDEENGATGSLIFSGRNSEREPR